MSTFGLARRLAQRELRSGLSGFRIFFACLVLGVAAIAAVGSLADALLTGLSEQGRTLLGGDVALELVHRPMTDTERRFAAARGRVSETVSMRAMAYALKGDREAERQLIELKSVDGAYPLYGKAGLAPAKPLPAALACTDESGQRICGAVVEQTLLDRLKLARGGRLRIGVQTFLVSAVLTDEPDRISGGFSLGPHVIISGDALAHTGLVTLGSLIEYSYRIALPQQVSPASFRRAATAQFPDAGWQIRDRTDAAPGTRRLIEQVAMFLTLVGLTALAVGGVGAGQAVGVYLDRKRNEIATFKSLGAEGGLIFLVFFLQVMAIASFAVVAGVLLGAALPFLVARLLGGVLPTPVHYGVYVGPLALAVVFGLCSAAAFAIPPLARAREIAPASLFRDIVAPRPVHGRLPYLFAAGGATAAVIALALAISPSVIFALWFLAGSAAIFGLFRAMAEGLRFVLGRLPRARHPVIRLALANLTRPGAATVSVIVGLGLGLSLLAVVLLIDRTISAQVRDTLPATAPTFFFIDIQPVDANAFDLTVASFPSVRDYKRTPMIRGRIVALNGVAARDAKVAGNVRWALNGDRGITYAATPPKDADITDGHWWPANYTGPTLISFDAELAKGMGLKVGDTLTLNVLGRDIEGRIANLRNVDFANGRQNFALILSPGLIDKAPHSFLATVNVAPHDEEPLFRAVTDKFHGVSTVRVKDAIAQVNGLLQQLALGVRAASLVTIIAGLFVLAGAIAAGQRARLYDSTVMKVLGATRGQIAAVFGIEYALIGALTGILALAAGSTTAWLVARLVFEVPFAFDPAAAIFTVIGGASVALLFGLVAAWAALAAKPAERLRNP